MIITVSGSVGSGKTSFSKLLGKKLGFEVVCLNDWAEEFKIVDVAELQTFDFDIDLLLKKVEEYIAQNASGKNNRKGIIFEGHFAHFIDSKFVDLLFVVNRDLKDLKNEYLKRGYNEQKIADNLEVESFNLCFYEGIEEGYVEEKQVFCFDNNSSLEDLIDRAVGRVEKSGHQLFRRDFTD